MTHHLTINQIAMGNNLPISVIGGMNVLEDENTVFEVAEHFDKICQKLELPFIFKASFDKANRSSVYSKRGVGLEKGLALFQALKKQYTFPIATDIHLPEQAEKVAKVCDVLQIPAFLARQTDLLEAACKTQKVLHIKKPQFSAPDDMEMVLEKCAYFGNEQVILCERGSCFGYHNLVVDTLGIDKMKQFGKPVSMDLTHALQKPSALKKATESKN